MSSTGSGARLLISGQQWHCRGLYCGLRRHSHDGREDVRCVAQRRVGQMCIALSRRDLGMAEKLADFLNRDAGRDKDTCMGVAEIVNARIREPGSLPRLHPESAKRLD